MNYLEILATVYVSSSVLYTVFAIIRDCIMIRHKGERDFFNSERKVTSHNQNVLMQEIQTWRIACETANGKIKELLKENEALKATNLSRGGRG